VIYAHVATHVVCSEVTEHIIIHLTVQQQTTMYRSHAPVPVQSFVVMSIKEMHFWSAGAHIRVSAEKLEQSACSALLDADDDDVRQTPPSQ